MQTYRHLYSEITTFANLYAAYRRARKGKRNRPEVAAFEVDLETNLFQLQDALRDQSYTPGPYRNFYIRERKLRLISAAPFPDRVVHHALCAVTNPIWERRFIHDSYANRLGKGTHKALDRAQRFLLGSRLLDSAFVCHSHLIRARKVTGAARTETLLQADVTLDTLRLQLRLAHELRCLSIQQYERGANLLNQVGKLLGAWRKG